VRSQDPNLYFKHGIWNRQPKIWDLSYLRYAVVEDVEDRVLIGCQSRTIDYWLKLTLEQAAKFGLEFAEYYNDYRELVREVSRQKLAEPSPGSDIIKLDTEEWRLDYEDTQVAPKSVFAAGIAEYQRSDEESAGALPEGIF